MKTLNPFDRLKKFNDVPVSLFPCSKVTRTSLPIGRAVPLYTIEMMQGNHIKLDVTQLTRFMTMSAPVLQNYEITFGAFYCPYVALDDYTDPNKVYGITKHAGTGSTLRARQFFNPDTDNALRVHPHSITYNARANQSFSGSLFDHLQYKTFTDLNVEDVVMQETCAACNTAVTIVGLTNTMDWTPHSAQSMASFGNYAAAASVQDPNGMPYDPVDWDPSHDLWYARCVVGGTSVYYLPFGAWCAYKYHRTTDWGYTESNTILAGIKSALENFSFNDHTIITLTDTASSADTDYWKREVRQSYCAWTEDDDPSLTVDPSTYANMFGTATRSQIMEEYLQDLRAYVANMKYGTITESSVPWLIYHRIYADWFLPENFIDYEDYIAMVGSAYVHRSNNVNATMASAFTPSAASTSGNLFLNTTSNGAKICLNTFAEYCRKGECMPVLWQKDNYTGLLPNQQAQATPLGASIEEHLYQRTLAKFKDLIRRIGHDYRHNTAALYGSAVSDSTLLRSQVIGYRSFDVSIGDVAQTSETSENSELGRFAGYAVSRDRMGSFEWTAEENGMIMILAWVRPKYTALTNSHPRYLMKKDYGDYLNPMFGGVGYQPVTYGQLNPTGQGTDANVFGWQERYFEYMMVENECSGAQRNLYKHYNSDRTLATDPVSLTNLTNLKFLYMTEEDNLQRVFVDRQTDPVLISAFFEGNVTRQLPSKIRTDF